MIYTLVASLYDFESAGAGKFSFEPITTFLMASGAQAKVIGNFAKATAITNAVEVEVSGGMWMRSHMALENAEAPAPVSRTTTKET